MTDHKEKPSSTWEEKKAMLDKMSRELYGGFETEQDTLLNLILFIRDEIIG